MRAGFARQRAPKKAASTEFVPNRPFSTTKIVFRAEKWRGSLTATQLCGMLRIGGIWGNDGSSASRESMYHVSNHEGHEDNSSTRRALERALGLPSGDVAGGNSKPPLWRPDSVVNMAAVSWVPKSKCKSCCLCGLGGLCERQLLFPGFLRARILVMKGGLARWECLCVR